MMQGAITPIETIYNGRRFRSRLEARWAIYFDALGVRYEYEPEGFLLPSGKKYLPDFRVKCHGKRSSYDCQPFDLYIEVKGQMTQYDADRILEFAGLLDEQMLKCDFGHWIDNHNSILILGNIPNNRALYAWTSDVCDDFLYPGKFGIGPFNYYAIDGDWYEAFPVAHDGKLYLWGPDYALDETDFNNSIAALDKARQARFENF